MTDNSLEPDLRNQRKAGKDRTEERSPVFRGLNEGQLQIWMELSIKLQKRITGRGYQREPNFTPGVLKGFRVLPNWSGQILSVPFISSEVLD